MNLAQLASFTCSKVGQPDEDSLAACKDYLRARYTMIWDGAMWADSQRLISVSGQSATPSVVAFPDYVQRVVRMRNTGTASDVLGSSIGTLFDFDSGIFNQSGPEAKFIHLPAAIVPAAASVGRLDFAGTDEVASVEIVGGDGNGGILRETLTFTIRGQQEVTSMDFTGKTGSSFINGSVGRGFVIGGDAGLLGVWFNVGGTLTEPDFSSYNPVAMVEITGVSSGDSDTVLAANMCNVLDGVLGYFNAAAEGAVATIQARSNGARADAQDVDTGMFILIQQQGYITATATSVTEFVDLYSATLSQAVEHAVTITKHAGGAVGTIAAGNRSFPADGGTINPVQRVQMYPAQATAQTYLAHVKVKPAELGDSDSPQLSGVENALLAFAQADMLERQRQYAKSAAKMQEGQAQIQIMLDLEKNQQSYEARLIPAMYDEPYGSNGNDGFSEKGFW